MPGAIVSSQVASSPRRYASNVLRTMRWFCSCSDMRGAIIAWPAGASRVRDTQAMAEGDHDLVELTRRSMQAMNEGQFDAAMSVFAEDACFDVSAASVG